MKPNKPVNIRNVPDTNIYVVAKSPWPQATICRTIQDCLAFEANNPGGVVVMPHLEMYATIGKEVEILLSTARAKKKEYIAGHLSKSLFYTAEQWLTMYPDGHKKWKKQNDNDAGA